jgi:hypothetical protein
VFKVLVVLKGLLEVTDLQGSKVQWVILECRVQRVILERKVIWVLQDQMAHLEPRVLLDLKEQKVLKAYRVHKD